MNEDDSRDVAMSLATLLVAGLALFLLLLWVSTAPAAVICLTKQQARELWPRQHIYWYSSRHCWSNRRGPPRGLYIDPIFGAKAQAENDKKPRPEVKTVPLTEFNEIDAAADSDTYFRGQPFPLFGSLVTQENFEMEWKIRVEGALHQ